MSSEVCAATVARVCAACRETKGVEMHHLIPQVYAGNDGPMVPLCGVCHGLVHGIRRPIDLGALIRAGHARNKVIGRKTWGGSKKGRRATCPNFFNLNPHVHALAKAGQRIRADKFAEELNRLVEDAKVAGCFSFSSQARWLNEQQFTSAFGHGWTRHNLERATKRSAARVAISQPGANT